MQLPTTIKVGPHTYSVITDPKLISSHGVDYGMTKADDCEIFLNTDITDSQQRDTMLHEVLHAAIALVGLAGYDDSLVSNEEAFVRTLAPILLMILQDNPELVEFLV